MTTQWVLGPSLVMAFVVGLCLVLFYLMPRLTRPDVYFAVTVPPEFRDSAEGCSILKRYRVEATIFGVLALLIVLAAVRIPEPNHMMVVTLAGLVVQYAGVFLAYYRARRRVLPHAAAPATIREAVLVPRETHLPVGGCSSFLPSPYWPGPQSGCACTGARFLRSSPPTGESTANRTIGPLAVLGESMGR